MHGPEKIPNETFSLWNMIRDALDPLHESEKIKVKGEEEDTDSKLSYQQTAKGDAGCHEHQQSFTKWG